MVGCSVKSAGCRNCYAMALAHRLEAMGQATYAGTTRRASDGRPIWTGQINRSSPTTWAKPASVREPSIFFVNSMSDFFHANVPNQVQRDALEVMRGLPRHQFQVLTKRPENVLPWLKRNDLAQFPDNVWVGATVEDGRVIDRVAQVRAFPARIRFLSVEPLIGSVREADFAGIQWVITGGESGPGARPMDAAWVREVRDKLRALGVPHFFKQYGRAQNNPLWAEAVRRGLPPATFVAAKDPQGKGGSLLDGEYLKEMPAGYEVPDYDAKLADEKGQTSLF